jgi:hypothetical protein
VEASKPEDMRSLTEALADRELGAPKVMRPATGKTMMTQPDIEKLEAMFRQMFYEGELSARHFEMYAYDGRKEAAKHFAQKVADQLQERRC